MSSSISTGTRLGRYEIRSKIGEGGMGEVYLGEDLQLHRKVALKILPVELASNRDRMRRFEQEATAAAALNHPNIAHIYEIGAQDGIHFIAMEFVDGQTLRELIHHKQTELPKLLRYLQHAAQGLAKAHAAGIVHRDLKPDNIMVSHEGHAKILDFGLAKLIEPQSASGQRSDPLSEVATALMQHRSTPGAVLGTVGYMSPEQAQGRVNEIDHRSDIFSFGCILYEAITRHKAFEGKDAIDSLNKIIREQPAPINIFSPDAPADLQRVVRRCLAKDCDQRFQTIKDVAIDLREVRQDLKGKAGIDTTVPPPGSSAAGNIESRELLTSTQTGLHSTQSGSGAAPQSSAEYLVSGLKRHKIAVAGTLIGVVILAAGLWVLLSKLSSSGKPATTLEKMKLTRLTTSGKISYAAISPDGKYVVYSLDEGKSSSLWVRQVVTNSNIQIVPSTEGYFDGLTFSPDGNYVYYVWWTENPQVGNIYQLPTLGGEARKVVSDVFGTIALSPDGEKLAFFRVDRPAGETSLVLANADGANEKKLANRKSPEGFSLAALAWSKDGKKLVCGAGNSQSNDGIAAEILVADGSLREVGKQRWRSIRGIASTTDGESVIMAATPSTLTSAAKSQLWQVSLADGETRKITNDLNDYYTVSLTADSKSLVTIQGLLTSNIWSGPLTDLKQSKQVTFTPGAYEGAWGISWLPDNRVVFLTNATGNDDLWTMRADGTDMKQLTANASNNEDVAVTGDGRYLVFTSDRTGAYHIWRMGLDGSNPIQLTNGNGEFMPDASRDGKWIVYAANQAGQAIPTLWKVSIDGGQPIQLTDKYATQPAISPDGKTIACWYRGDDVKLRSRIALIPFDGGPPIKIFERPEGVYLYANVAWTPDGKALLFTAGAGTYSDLFSQPIDGGKPTQLSDVKPANMFYFDISRDGKQLVYARGNSTSDVIMLSGFR